jgi:hypothetical protein
MKNKFNVIILILFVNQFYGQKLSPTQDSLLKSMERHFYDREKKYPYSLTFYPKSAFKHPKIEQRFMDALYQRWSEEDMMHSIMESSFKDSTLYKIFIMKAKEIVKQDTLRFKKVYDSILNDYVLREKKDLKDRSVRGDLYYTLIWFKGKEAIPILLRDLNDKKSRNAKTKIRECLAKLKVEPYYSEMINELNIDKTTRYSKDAMEMYNKINFLHTQEAYSMFISILESDYKELYMSSSPPCLVSVRLIDGNFLQDITNLFEGMPEENKQFEKLKESYSTEDDKSIKEMCKPLIKWLKAYKGKYKLVRDEFWDDRKNRNP